MWFWSVTCLRVLHPYIAHCQYLLTGGRFLPFIRMLALRTPHAICIFMSHRVSLVKSSPLQIGTLHIYINKTDNALKQCASCNNCCRRKIISISPSDCVCSLMYLRCKATSYGQLWPVWFCHIIPHYLINNKIFGKYFLNMKYIWIFLYNFYLKHFLF